MVIDLRSECVSKVSLAGCCAHLKSLRELFVLLLLLLSLMNEVVILKIYAINSRSVCDSLGIIMGEGVML